MKHFVVLFLVVLLTACFNSENDSKINVQSGVWTSPDTIALISDTRFLGASKSYFNQAASSTRIVGGYNASITKYPSMASLGYISPSNEYSNFDKHFCGLSYIGNSWFLLAAHCVSGSTSPEGIFELRVAFNQTNLERSSPLATVKTIIVHPLYDKKTFQNDIALLQINNTTEEIKKTNIYQGSYVIPGTLTTPIGWGAISENGTFSPTLQEVKIPIVSNEVCSQNYNNYPSFKFDNTVICAGYDEGGRDSCQGDSGGPLFVYQGWEVKQVGIVSWGDGCAEPNKPGVYTFIPAYESWIESIVGFNVIPDRVLGGNSLMIDGTISTNENSFSLKGTEYDINFVPTASINETGSTDGYTLTNKNMDISHNVITNFTSSISFLVGEWEMVDNNNNPLIYLRITSQGVITGEDVNECSLHGNVSIINISKNLYSVDMNEVCYTGSSSLTGLAAIGNILLTPSDESRVLYMFIANENKARPLYLKERRY